MTDLLNVKLPFPGMQYRHYKGGIYVVLGFSRNSDYKKEITVLYFSLEKKILWNRDLYDWCDVVKWPDGVCRQRFFPDETSFDSLTYPESAESNE